MNKFLLAAFIFPAFYFMSFSEDKIAIVGDSNEANKVADLVSSALSSAYAVQERGEIENMLKEQKLSFAGIGSTEILSLSKFLHVDYFITISSRESKKKAVPSSLMLFDAANGFSLLDKGLPEDVEKAAEYSVGEIKKALSASQKTENRKFLSVLSVRNAGAPKKYEADFANIVIEVERALASSPVVAILERESLGMVNQERKISESFSRLKISAYLLDFDFLPGPEVSHVDLSLNILDLEGKQISQIKVENCLKDPKATIETVLAGLSKFFSMPVSPTDKVSDKKEAERFFNEYKFCDRIGDIKGAERKLEAAIALKPDSIQYRFEMATFKIKKAENTRSQLKQEAQILHLLDGMNKGIDILEEIKERFPDSKGKLSFLPISVLSNMIKNNRYPLSKETRKKIDDLSRRYRKHQSEGLKNYYSFDLADGINSLDEMKKFSEYSARMSFFSNYLDNERMAVATFKTAEEVLRYGAEFLKKNPDILNKIPYRKQRETFVVCPQFFMEQNSVMKNAIKNSAPLITAAMEHPSPAAKAFGLEIDLLRKTIINNYAAGKFSEDMDLMLEEIDKLKVPPSPEAADFHAATFTNPFFHFYEKLNSIYYRKQIEYMRAHKQKVSWYIVREYFYVLEKDNGKLAEVVEFLEPELSYMKTTEKWQNRNELEYRLKEATKRLSADKERYAKALQILQQKKAVKVKEIFSSDSSQHSQIWNIQESDGRIYALMNSGTSCQVYMLDPDSEKVTLAGKSSKEFNNFIIDRGFFGYEPFAVSGKYFLIGGQKAIMVIPANGTEEHLINDLPCENISALAMMDGRIYAFAGNGILFSLLPDGTDRKIHISTLRTEKKCSLDKFPKLTVTGLFPDPARKRLLLLASANKSNVGGLWELDIETGQTRLLLDFERGHESLGLRVDDMLYIGTDSFCKSYTFDMEKDKADFVYLSDDMSSVKYMKGLKPRYVQRQHVSPPFFCRGNLMWFGGGSCRLMNAEKLSCLENIDIPSRSPSAKTFFYPHPDGMSVYAFNGKGIYKLTPQ